MQVKLQAITPNIEETIVEIARASSSRKDKKSEAPRLINYLIKHSHWSPFEHGFLTFEIVTSKAIAIQLLRHRSNYFQEFSQRYQDVNEMKEDPLSSIFEEVEIRRQAKNNRQSSEEVFDPVVLVPRLHKGKASDAIDNLLNLSHSLYNELLEVGVAREVARMVLPMCTKTRLYVTMNVRSVVHWLDLRDDGHAQKEIQQVAKEIKKIFIQECPNISSARGYIND